MPNGHARSALTALAAVGAIGAGAAIWGIGIERYLFTIREHEARILPTGAPPVRVLHISDAHMAPWQRRKQRWMAALAESGLPAGQIPLALLSFNVGIELGQLAFVGSVLLVGALLTRWMPAAERRATRPAVYAMGILSAFWCFERVALWLG